jgi:hypothetical protein
VIAGTAREGSHHGLRRSERLPSGSGGLLQQGDSLSWWIRRKLQARLVPYGEISPAWKQEHDAHLSGRGGPGSIWEYRTDARNHQSRR